MNTVVVAHYNKDIEWTRLINANVVIYSTSDNPPQGAVKCVNKGMDASMYLSYIIDNYDNLPDRVLFLHHHQTDWTQELSGEDLANNLNWDCDDYFSVCEQCNHWNIVAGTEQERLLKENIHITGLKYAPELFYIAGTQFCVSKQTILQHPKQYYEGLREWLYSTELPDFWSGRFFEYTWHYIFTGNPIDRLHENRFKT